MIYYTTPRGVTEVTIRRQTNLQSVKSVTGQLMTTQLIETFN